MVHVGRGGPRGSRFLCTFPFFRFALLLGFLFVPFSSHSINNSSNSHFFLLPLHPPVQVQSALAWRPGPSSGLCGRQEPPPTLAFIWEKVFDGSFFPKCVVASGPRNCHVAMSLTRTPRTIVGAWRSRRQSPPHKSSVKASLASWQALVAGASPDVSFQSSPAPPPPGRAQPTAHPHGRSSRFSNVVFVFRAAFASVRQPRNPGLSSPPPCIVEDVSKEFLEKVRREWQHPRAGDN